VRERGERQAATAARRLSCLRGFFRYLAREGTVARDPAALAFGPRYTRWRLPGYLTVPEQTRVLAQLAADPSLHGQRDRALIATLLLTGLRAAEACALRLPELNLESGVLRVIQGKGGKDREVPVPPSLGALLTAYLREVRPRLLAADRSPYLFLHLPVDVNFSGRRPSWGGEPLSRQQLFRAVVTRVSPLVGRRVGPHTLRHSYASRLRAAGADLQLIQECLGHAAITTTTIYAHLATPARLAEVARLLEANEGRP
jgi:integrase/recombinase XerD